MNRSLDVLWASDALVPAAGGAERSTLEWLDALVARGHRARAVCIAAPPRAEAMPVPSGVEIRSVATPPSASKRREAWYWRARLDRSDAMGAAVEAAIAERRPDVVIAQLHGAPGALAAAAKAGLPAVLVLHSYEALCKVAFDPGSDCRAPHDCIGCPHTATLSAPERAALLELRARHDEAVAGAEAIIAPSEWMAEVLTRWSGRRAAVVRYALTAPRGIGGSYEGPVVFAANQWAPHKGLDLLPMLVAAARRAPAPSGSRIVHVTERGLGDTVRAAVAAAGAEVVANAPFAALAAGASAVVMPSQWDEPFGRLAWEAMAAGIPALASDAGALSEFTPADMLVSPRDDPGAWSRAFDRLFASREAWMQAGADSMRSAAAILDPAPAARLESVLTAAAESSHAAIGGPGAV